MVGAFLWWRCVFLRYEDHWKRITQLEHVIHVHLDLVHARFRELHIAEQVHVGARIFRPIKIKLHLIFAQHRGLIGHDYFRVLRKIPHPCSPAVEAHQLERGDRQLWHDQLAKDANENRIAIGFLANVLAQQRALEIGIWPAKIIAYYADRESGFGKLWRMSSAALLPAGILLAMGCLCYAMRLLPMMGLLILFPVHLILGGVYLFFSAFSLPKIVLDPANAFDDNSQANAEEGLDDSDPANPFAEDNE